MSANSRQISQGRLIGIEKMGDKSGSGGGGGNACRQKATVTDFSHKRPRMKQAEPKVDRRHENVYHGLSMTEVTSHVHLATPSHSYGPDLKDAPTPYYGLKTSNVTDWIQPKQKRFNPQDNFYHPVTTSDVTTMLRIPIPSHPANQTEPGAWHGRTKTFVTDPGVDDFTTSYAQAEASRARRDKEGKVRCTQAPLGKSKSCGNLKECL